MNEPPLPPHDSASDAALPSQICQVFPADAFYVISGVNSGDGMNGPDEVCEGDIYTLEEGARPLRLALSRGPSGQQIAEGSQFGTVGQSLTLTARYTLMAPDATKVEVLFLTLPDGDAALLPLSPIGEALDYALVAINPAPEDVPLADLVCVSFARGTMITLADGRQRAIESLSPGDRVLTRDRGAQPVRWLGRATLRAVGSFAPIVISAGTLGNAGDLIVSPHHRIFLYQRKRKPGLETAEILIQAKHLIDGEKVFQREGGYVDYFSLVFDHHEIIYAEGVPAESLMVNDATISRLPTELADDVKARFPGLAQSQHFGTEAGRQLLDLVGRDALLGRPVRKPRSD